MCSSGDGALDFMEFFVYLVVLIQEEGNVDVLKALFDVYDLNNDGFICYNEIRHFLLTKFGSEKKMERVLKKANLNEESRVNFDGKLQYTSCIHFAKSTSRLG